MAEVEVNQSEATLIAACIAAAASIVVARGMQVGLDPEKQIAERAFRIYEAALSRFELPASARPRGAETLELVAGTGGLRRSA
jgi:hypothetical protein